VRRRDFIAGLGGTAAWPLAARAQQRPVPVIGYLGGLPSPAFLQGLGELGYVEGRNVEILSRGANFIYDRIPALAADLVRHRVAVIYANAASALVAKAATATIPIVFATSADPVELGLVASLNRPGGNVTGVTTLAQESTAKRLELLHEIVPAVTTIGFLVNPTGPTAQAEIREAGAAAQVLGVRLVILNASNLSEIGATFATLVEQRIGALLVGGDGLFLFRAGAQIVALTGLYKVPASYTRRGEVLGGGLMSYGARLFDADRLAGTYVGRILKGEKPADLPVQQPTRLELVLNLKTAKALGLKVPDKLLVFADEVIE
jgi:putative ABC transport system substrate-binding protein